MTGVFSKRDHAAPCKCTLLCCHSYAHN